MTYTANPVWWFTSHAFIINLGWRISLLYFHMGYFNDSWKPSNWSLTWALKEWASGETILFEDQHSDWNGQKNGIESMNEAIPKKKWSIHGFEMDFEAVFMESKKSSMDFGLVVPENPNPFLEYDWTYWKKSNPILRLGFNQWNSFLPASYMP